MYAILKLIKEMRSGIRWRSEEIVEMAKVVRFLKVSAIDNYAKSVNFGKRVEFVVEDNCAGRERMSLYDNCKIVEEWTEEF